MQLILARGEIRLLAHRLPRHSNHQRKSKTGARLDRHRFCRLPGAMQDLRMHRVRHVYSSRRLLSAAACASGVWTVSVIRAASYCEVILSSQLLLWSVPTGRLIDAFLSEHRWGAQSGQEADQDQEHTAGASVVSRIPEGRLTRNRSHVNCRPFQRQKVRMRMARWRRRLLRAGSCISCIFNYIPFSTILHKTEVFSPSRSGVDKFPETGKTASRPAISILRFFRAGFVLHCVSNEAWWRERRSAAKQSQSPRSL